MSLHSGNSNPYRCDVCVGNGCAICDWSGTDAHLTFPIPASHCSEPWALFPRATLVTFLARLYDAKPEITLAELGPIVESFYEAARFGCALGFESGLGEARR